MKKPIGPIGNDSPNRRHAKAEIPTEMQSVGVNKLLKERDSRYGDFRGQAAIAQRLKIAMWIVPNWNTLTHAQKEALEMIQVKISRILNGNSNYKDSWTDIIGYAGLVERELK